MSNPISLDVRVLSTIGRGIRRNTLLNILCPVLYGAASPPKDSPLATDVDVVVDRMIDKGWLIDVMSGMNQGWLDQICMDAKVTERIRFQNEKFLSSRIDAPLVAEGKWEATESSL